MPSDMSLDAAWTDDPYMLAWLDKVKKALANPKSGFPEADGDSGKAKYAKLTSLQPFGGDQRFDADANIGLSCKWRG